MLKSILKVIIGILIIPFAAGATAAFYRNLVLIKSFSGEVNIFGWGVLSYCVMHMLFYKPMAVYVFGHEAVHAAAAWLCGGSIQKFEAKKDGGKVKSDKSNLFITLSPYFVPIYTLCLVAFYFVLSSSYEVSNKTFVFLIGFSVAFHIIMTVEAIKLKQPDIIHAGPFFSVIIVYALNVVVISMIFAFVFPGFAILNYWKDLFSISFGMYAAIVQQLFF